LLTLWTDKASVPILGVILVRGVPIGSCVGAKLRREFKLEGGHYGRLQLDRVFPPSHQI
jgi:hypothetical protein